MRVNQVSSKHGPPLVSNAAPAEFEVPLNGDWKVVEFPDGTATVCEKSLLIDNVTDFSGSVFLLEERP